MNELDKFGQFLIENLRDKALEQNEMLLEGKLLPTQLLPYAIPKLRL